MSNGTISVLLCAVTVLLQRRILDRAHWDMALHSDTAHLSGHIIGFQRQLYIVIARCGFFDIFDASSQLNRTDKLAIHGTCPYEQTISMFLHLLPGHTPSKGSLVFLK